MRRQNRRRREEDETRRIRRRPADNHGDGDPEPDRPRGHLPHAPAAGVDPELLVARGERQRLLPLLLSGGSGAGYHPPPGGVAGHARQHRPHQRHFDLFQLVGARRVQGRHRHGHRHHGGARAGRGGQGQPSRRCPQRAHPPLAERRASVGLRQRRLARTGGPPLRHLPQGHRAAAAAPRRRRQRHRRGHRGETADRRARPAAAAGSRRVAAVPRLAGAGQQRQRLPRPRAGRRPALPGAGPRRVRPVPGRSASCRWPAPP